MHCRKTTDQYICCHYKIKVFEFQRSECWMYEQLIVRLECKRISIHLSIQVHYVLMHLNNKPVAWHFDVDILKGMVIFDTWLLACFCGWVKGMAWIPMESSPATQIINGEVNCNLSLKIVLMSTPSHTFNILHCPTVLTHISSKWNKLLQSCVGTPGHIYLILQ